jgi:uncharacterized cupredoxin-like copper-binding protein
MEKENKRSRVPRSLMAIAVGIVALATVAAIVAVAVLAIAGGGSSEGGAAISSSEITKVPGPGRNPALPVHVHEHDADVREADVVEMTLNVVEGRRWSFDPAVIEVSDGERVMLILVNDGRAVHDVEIAGVPAEEIEVVSSETRAAAGGGHHDEAVVAAHASPGTTAAVLFTPTEAGEYEFACTIPGHKEAGMVGKLIVTP